jgi:hypothetical protein
MSTDALAEARLVVSRLEAESEAKERARLVGHLEGARTDLARFRAREAEIKPVILRQREDRQLAQAAVARANNALSDHLTTKPAVYDYLPADPEVQAWEHKRHQLQQRRDELVVERNRLPDPDTNGDTDECIRLGHDIGQLKFAVNNLLAALERRSGKAWVPASSIEGVR